jgi:polar amino acid transport system permease protein
LGRPGRALHAPRGLKNTLRVAVFAVIGSTVVGVLLGTLMTIRFLPLRSLLRLYVEVWRGLPILVTIFLVYYALPTTPYVHHRFGAFTAGAIGLTLWGSAQVAERHAAPSSPSRASSTRPLPRSASAGSGGTCS